MSCFSAWKCYLQIFLTYRVSVCIFWQKGIGEKAARKMLVKLTCAAFIFITSHFFVGILYLIIFIDISTNLAEKKIRLISFPWS